ncbi:MAG: GatB/YqeY domain-containing protein [Arenibacterium sp.]
MDLRARVNTALKQAMRDKDATRLSTLRLINAAIKDQDIAARASDGESGSVGDNQVLAILGKMTKQRFESARAYEEGGRLDLAERERDEVAVFAQNTADNIDSDERDTERSSGAPPNRLASMR